MSETPEILTQDCTSCGALIDVSEMEPLALFHCPSCGEAMRVKRAFGNFELLEVLGAGGMGAVYRAQDTSLNRSVALKLLRREYSEHPEVTKQFEHEAALTAQINHPNVVKVYSTGTDHGLFYIAMELVDKGSLDDLMTLQGKVAEAQVLHVGIQIAQGLKAALQSGLIHRDVKPGNILFAGANVAKIVDFGLAAPMDGDAGMAGEIWGTPYYVAPEKLDHPPQEDFRSDIYSLGATLFHALAGRPPYEAEDASMVALKHLKSQPVSLQAFAPGISSGTAYVINRTLHKDPAQRYQSYDELIQHLEYARQQLIAKVSQPKQAVTQRRVVMESKGQQWAMSFITLLMLAALGAGGYWVYQNRERFFPTATKAKRETTAGPSDKQRYEDARRLVISGQPEPGAVALRALEAEGKLTEPTLSWTTFQAGLGFLMANKTEDARAEFEKLSKRGPTAGDTYEAKLSMFLATLSTVALDDKTPAKADADKYAKDNYEAIGPLLLAVKAWDQGEFEVALELFNEFRGVYPEQAFIWISDYKNMVVDFERSYENYKEFAAELAKLAGEPAKAKKELPALKEKRDSLKLKGALAKKGNSAIRRLEQEVTDFEAEQVAATKDMEGSDDETLTKLDTQLKGMAAKFQFKEAVIEVKKATVITDHGKKAKANLMKKYDWLAAWKSTLTQDFGVRGYTAGVPRKVGVPVAGVVNDADETDLIVTFPNSTDTVKVPWTDASLDGLFAISRTYLTEDLPPDRLADRMWFLGVFCDFFGKSREAGVLFNEAVKRKPAYKEELVLFPNAGK